MKKLLILPVLSLAISAYAMEQNSPDKPQNVENKNPKKRKIAFEKITQYVKARKSSASLFIETVDLLDKACVNIKKLHQRDCSMLPHFQNVMEKALNQGRMEANWLPSYVVIEEAIALIKDRPDLEEDFSSDDESYVCRHHIIEECLLEYSKYNSTKIEDYLKEGEEENK
jgi:hypothetical protein